jgi:molybdopterin synthase catalytic subunit
VHVTIRLFARLRELAGGTELTRELPDGATASDAWHALAAEFPALGDYTRIVSCAVNEEYARLTATLKDGDEVAFLPPVSGGSGLRERAKRVSHASGAGLRGPREGVCRGVRRGEAPR